MKPCRSSSLPGLNALAALAAFALAAAPRAALAQSLSLTVHDHVTVAGSGTSGVVNGSSVDNGVNSYTGSNSAVQVNGAASFTLGVGGSVTGTSNAYGVFADTTGAVWITGGTLTSQGFGAGLFAHGGSPVRISGGTFSGAQSVGAYDSGSAVIIGGTFTTPLLAYFGGTITVAGGDFSSASTSLKVANNGNPHTTINLFGSGFSYTPNGGSATPISSGQIPSGSGVITGTLAYDGARLSTSYSNDNAIINVNVGSPPTFGSTIDTALACAWGANIGWTNWRPTAAGGAVIGEYVCSGYLYSANVGWINLGSGSPANAIQYQNNTANDWGVNYLPSTTPGVASLRGYAYGANIGWINFEAWGNPSVNLLNGQLFGYAYSANCGWINLGNNTAYVVKTDSIAPGVDTNGNGIADAWELIHFGNLTTATATSDADGDGISDLDEYVEGSDPNVANDSLRITGITKTMTAGTVTLGLTFTTNASRLYQIETSGTLVNPAWTDAGLGIFVPDSNTSTTRSVNGTGAAQFFRVRALRLGF